MSAQKDYWIECMSNAAEECGLSLTEDQLKCLAEFAESGHENYGMAFYQPPASDYFDHEKRELERRLKEAKQETENIRADFVKNICKRRNCEPHQVILEGNGEATIIR